MCMIVSFTLHILCIICFVKSILTDESNEGRCPNITGAQDFSLDKVLGHWYGIWHRNFKVARCLEVTIQYAVDGNLIVSFLHRDESDAEVRQYLADISHPNDPAIVDAYLLNEDEKQFWGTWVFFYADYNNCYGVAKCDDTTGFEAYDGKHRHKVTIAISCRKSHPSHEDLQHVFDEMKKQGLGNYKMKGHDHENCSK